MNVMMKTGFVIAAIAIPFFFFWKDIKAVVSPTAEAASVKVKDKKKDKKDEGEENKEPSDVTIVNKWDTPDNLLEISGIAWMGNNLFACVQDEEGIIFIYNTATQKIEKQISFADKGDYEGIAINGNTVYVMRADGKLFEVADINAAKPSVKLYSTHLTEKHDVEGLTFDKNNNRLLAAIKGDEPGNKNYKGIYAFDITTKKMASQPVFKIDMDHELFKEGSKKKSKKIQPSEIAVHPLTQEIYITDADGKLLVMDKRGTIKSLYNMTDKEFSQAEGITFSPDGKLYISNEGKKQSGNILEISLNETSP